MNAITRIAVLLFAAILVVLVSQAGAALPPAAALDVTLYSGDAVIAQTLTDPDGIFTLADLAAGSYALVVADASGSMALRLPLEIAAEVAPATLAGQVEIDATREIGLKVSARVVDGSDPGTLAVERLALNPKKWNRNYALSFGKIKVKAWGAGLESIATVTLSTSKGSISSTALTLDSVEGTAQAAFNKAAAYSALVPQEVPAGSYLEVNVTVEGPGFSQSWVRQVLILGKVK